MTIRRGNSIIAGNSADIPSQTGQSGKFLTTNGTTTSWATVNVDTSDIYNKIDTKQDKSTAVNYNNISNCITYIPQDIKLELNNGTLTLKAGSKVYVPNGKNADGSNKFDVIILNNDQTISRGFNGKNVALFYRGHQRMSLDRIFSGDTMPSTTNNDDIWYDTASNEIKTYKTASSSWVHLSCSLPVGLATANTNGTGFTSINQVFNGFGYIGSTVFALPGVKGLIPNGRNADGSLKSIEVIINDVKIISDNAASKLLLMKESGDLEYAYGNFYIRDSLPVASSSYERCFVVPENQMYYHDTVSTIWSKRNYIIVGNMNKNYTENITSFIPKTVFHTLDYNDKSTISGWSMPSSQYIDLTLGADGTTYVAPANGYFCVKKDFAASGQYIWFELYNSTNTVMDITFWGSGSGFIGGFIPVSKGSKVRIHYNASGSTLYFRFIYAEGESYNPVSRGISGGSGESGGETGGIGGGPDESGGETGGIGGETGGMEPDLWD